MHERYNYTRQFLVTYVQPGAVVADLGCGPGLFVIESLKLGAGTVHAVDFSEAALEVTREAVRRLSPGGDVLYLCADVQTRPLPKSDVAVAMGLTPYLTDLPVFLSSALSSTKILLCLYADPDHWANRLRRRLPFLDVRNLHTYSQNFVDEAYLKNGARLLTRRKSGTCFIDIVSSGRLDSE